jgi:hypothetical protein
MLKYDVNLGVVVSMSPFAVIAFAGYMISFSILALGLFYGLRAAKLI